MDKHWTTTKEVNITIKGIGIAAIDDINVIMDCDDSDELVTDDGN